jgi:hypothetical protein
MVLSRALSLAAVTLLVGCCAIGQVEAQENLEAGKSPSQIFAGTCTACHKGARGLLKTVAPGSLQGFLRQHYTTSPEMAGVLASYLMSNGATDTRYGDKQKSAKDGKEGRETKSEARPTTKPDAGTAQGEAEPGRKRLARPTEPSEVGKPGAEGQMPPAASELGPEGRKAKQQRLGKRGKPGQEEGAPKAADKAIDKPVEPAKEEAAGGEPAKSDTAKVEPEPAKTEPAKLEPARSESAKSESAKSESAKSEEGAKSVESAKPVEIANPVESPAQSADADATKEKVNEALPPSLRRDPVPPVTQAPAAAAPAPASSAAAPASAAGGANSQVAAPANSTPPASPSVTASTPPQPAEPAGDPEPPISR